jgi:hypothetical protein
MSRNQQRVLFTEVRRSGPRSNRLLLVSILTIVVCGVVRLQRVEAASPSWSGQGQLPTGTPESWADAATRNEVEILQQEGSFSIRFMERKVDSKGDTLREIIESKQGSVARLVERGGKPITAAEDTAERARLQYALDHPDEFFRHHRRDAATRNDAMQLIKMMPKAMLYSFAPDQPQPPGATSKQVVLDFKPSPEFHPPTMMSEILTGLQGRVWIDEATQRVTRIEGHVLHVINFGFGVVARLYPGGFVEFEQTNVGGEHWVFSHLDEHLVVRALMVKTMPEDARMTSSNFVMLPTAVSYQDAIKMLLQKSIPLL